MSESSLSTSIVLHEFQIHWKLITCEEKNRGSINNDCGETAVKTGIG
jgi:hypothetical protein